MAGFTDRSQTLDSELIDNFSRLKRSDWLRHVCGDVQESKSVVSVMRRVTSTQQDRCFVNVGDPKTREFKKHLAAVSSQLKAEENPPNLERWGDQVRISGPTI